LFLAFSSLFGDLFGVILRLHRIIFFLIVLGVFQEALPAATVPAHPRLILTPARAAVLRSEIGTVRKELWPPALGSAERLATMPIPEMHNANNRLRFIGDTMPVLGLAYRMTGDRRYAEAADRWLRALVAVPAWNGSANLGRSAWVVGSALLYDWLYDELPSKTRLQVRTRLAAEGEILLQRAAYWRLLSNHCLIETSALGFIGLALSGEDQRADAFLAKARERTALIIEHAPLDGSWGEGVQYWQYGLGYLLRYLEASRTAGDRDYYSSYEWLKKTGFFAIHFSLPGRPDLSVNFSDSGGQDYVGSFLFYLPASVYRNGFYQDFGNRARSSVAYKFSWMDFLAYDPTIAPVDIRTLPAFKHFNDNDIVIMRSSWKPDATLVGFRAGPAPGHRNQADPRRLDRHGFGPGHGHPDINSFCLFAFGKWLALDPGYVHQKWTRDHNTVLVNGRGQAGEGSEWLDYMAFESRQPAPSVLRAETNPEFDYVIGDAGGIYVDEAGVEHFRRHLLFLKPHTVVILDDVKSRQPARVDWLLHARDKLAGTGAGQFEIVEEGVRLWIQPLLPKDYRHTIESRAFEASGTNGNLTSLDLIADSNERTTFLVVLHALEGAGDKPPQVELKNGHLKISSPARVWNVEVLDPAGPHNPSLPLLRVE